MSDNVHSQGYFGKLKQPVGDDNNGVWESISEHLQKHDLYLNYEGTMIFSDNQSNTYDCGLIFVKPDGAREFRDLCLKAGYDVDPVKHYTCIWYNGSDSTMAEAKVKEVFE